MRIRSIKPEFWRSDDITTLDWDVRLLFIGLWSYVDDNGVGLDKLSAIAADLFAGDLEREVEDDSRDSRDTFARVSRGLQQLFEAGRIDRYTVEGKRYLSITNWARHQRIDRPNNPRYPESPTLISILRDTRELPATPSRHPRESPATGTEEQGNRGTEEQGINDSVALVVPDDFGTFYAAYPRKAGRAAAEKAFAAAVKKVGVRVVLDGVLRYAQDPNLPEKTYIPHPATWLNQGRWDDEALPARGGRPTSIDRGREADAELARREAERAGRAVAS